MGSIIVACLVLIFAGPIARASTSRDASPSRGQPLELPQLAGLHLPPAASPLSEPQIPSDFFGCWSGTPFKFTALLPAGDANPLYRLQRVTKCYYPGRIQTQDFSLELAPRLRWWDTMMGLLNLGYHNTTVVDEKTAVYALAPNQIYSRGWLTLDLTESSIVTYHRVVRQKLMDEEIATLVTPSVLSIEGRTYLTGSTGLSMGSWHATLSH